MDPARLLADLDEHQRRAVAEPSSPLCILAGAGSGKTRVLTRRIAYRCATDDADPRRVLALTFTRRAAGELRTRLRALGLRDDLAAGTFHGVAWAQLRARWDDQGTTPWRLLDRKVGLVASVLPAAQRRGAVPLDVVGEIEWGKARMVSPEDYPTAAAAAGRRVPVDASVIATAWREYEARKRRERLLDFDDLLRAWRAALDRDPAFADAQRWRFRHVFVDEFQDVNPLQHAVLEALVGETRDLCAVGDPNQAIYAWNGADNRFLVGFDRYWPGGSTVELVDNYRSSPQILDAARAVLGRRGAGRLVPHRPDGPEPTIRSLPDDRAEAAAVARAVRDRHQPGRAWARQAVLVRTNAQTALLEQALRSARVPYRVRGGSGLLERPEVKAVLADLRRRPATPFTAVLADLEAAARQATPATTPDSEGTGGGTDDDDGGDDERANLEALTRLAHDFGALSPAPTAGGFLGWLTETLRADDHGRRDDAVEIVTFHAAKGLEWPVVHLAGLEDGLVPIGHARTPEAQAEEARLVYVALTRAQEELHLTWAQLRTFGDRERTRQRSPYLDQIERPMAAGDRAPAPTSAGGDHAPVVAALRAWRTEEARRRGVPAYRILANATIDDIATRRPRTRVQLGRVRGVGPRTLAEHGDAILALISGAPGGAPTDDRDDADELRDVLVQWRAAKARAAGAPAYTVFDNRTLDDLVQRRPTDRTTLLAVRGLGLARVDRFGDELLTVLAETDRPDA